MQTDFLKFSYYSSHLLISRHPIRKSKFSACAVTGYCSFKPISKRKKRRLLKPWVTKGTRKSIKITNDLYCSGVIAAYKLYRNKVLTLTRMSKNMYFHKYFEENFTNTKKMWEASTAFWAGKTKLTKYNLS